VESRACLYCQESFSPNKYSPRQKVCSKSECQKKRQLDSMKQWREANPNYFKYDESKGMAWLEMQRRRSKQWREKNPEKVRSYRKEHIDEYRQYMREYMRSYREKKKQSGPENGQGVSEPPPTPPPAQ
jgi:hypothetical protein